MMKHWQEFSGNFLFYYLVLFFFSLISAMKVRLSYYLLENKNLHVASFRCFVVPKKTSKCEGCSFFLNLLKYSRANEEVMTFKPEQL